MSIVEEYKKESEKDEKDKTTSLTKWLEVEKMSKGNNAHYLNYADELADMAEKAKNSTISKDYYKNLSSIKAINKNARQGVLDSYGDFYANNQYALADLSQSRFLGYAFLSYLAQDAFVRRGVTTRADEMTREWGEITSEDKEETTQDKITFITEEQKRLKAKETFKEAGSLTGFFGGCLVYIDVRYNENEPLSDEELATPLYKDGQDEFNKAKLSGMKLCGLKPIEPINIAPSTYQTSDPTAQNFYKPEHYYILGKKIHASRFLYFAENIPPQILKPVYLFFGIPMAQIMFPYVQAFYKSKDVVNNVVLKFSCTCLATEIDALIASDGQTAVRDRISTIAKYRDNNSVIMIDKNTEAMEQINTPIGGLREILYANLELLPVICGIPTTKYLETSPTGLNATGEFDMRNFYDAINTLQNNVFNEPMDKLNNIICYCNGLEYKGLVWTWKSLYKLNEREQAEVNRMKAETNNIYVQMGAVSNTDVAKQLQKDKNSDFDTIEIPEPIIPEGSQEEVEIGENGADSEIDKIIKDEEIKDAEFEESKHPRNDDGTFKEKGASEQGPFSNYSNTEIDNTIKNIAQEERELKYYKYYTDDDIDYPYLLEKEYSLPSGKIDLNKIYNTPIGLLEMESYADMKEQNISIDEFIKTEYAKENAERILKEIKEDEKEQEKMADKINKEKRNHFGKRAALFENILKNLGLNPKIDISNQSFSTYISFEDTDGDDWTIRLSDHFTTSAHADLWLYIDENIEEQVKKIKDFLKEKTILGEKDEVKDEKPSLFSKIKGLFNAKKQ